MDSAKRLASRLRAQKKYYVKTRAKRLAVARAYYKANRSKILLAAKAYAEKNRKKRAAYAKAYNLRNRAKTRKKRGMPEPTRAEPANCECCGRQDARRLLNLDHDHVTGAFRGWLCNPCNRAAGLLGDTLEGVQRMAGYLERAG